MKLMALALDYDGTIAHNETVDANVRGRPDGRDPFTVPDGVIPRHAAA